ncbi:MAG: indolepyruvate oxidoreductase subunit beta [Clostridia bacterium]
MLDNINFLIVGVGGQGTILSSDILSEVGMEMGYDAKKSDILGLAVRGGSVCSHVRWGKHVGSPMSMPGTIDYLIACEPLESLRMLEYLKPDSTIIYNDYRLPPMLVSTGKAVYPSHEEVEKYLHLASKKVISYDATTITQQMGTAKAMNVMLLGTLCGVLGMDTAAWEKVIKKYVPAKYATLNLDAFNAGRGMAK